MNDHIILKKIFDASPLPSLLIRANDPFFTLVDANESYYKISNSTQEDLIGKGLFEAFPQNPNENSGATVKLLDAIKTVMVTKETYNAPIQKYDIPIRGTDQFEVRYWDPVFIPILNEKKEVSHILHTTENVSIAVQAEKALSLSNKKLNDLISSIDGIFWEAEINPLKFTFVSPQSYEILGFHPKEWETSGFWESRIHPFDQEFTINYCENQVQQGKNHFFEYRFLAKNGNTVWLNDVVSVILENGKPILLRGIMTDITDKKKSELERDKSRSKLENIMDRSLDVICTLDENRLFQEVSSATLKLWGYLPSEMVGKPLLDYVLEEDISKINDAIRKIRNGKSRTNLEIRIIKKNGSMAPTIWSIKWDIRDKIFYCCAKDGSEKKKTELNNELRIAINSIFSEDLKLEIIIQKALKLFLQYSNLDYAEAWLQSIDSDNIILTAFEGPEHIQPKKEIRINGGESGLMSELCKSKEPILIKDLKTHSKIVRNDFIIKHDVRSTIAYPINYNGQFIAGIVLCSIARHVDFETTPILDFDFLAQIGSMIKRKRAENELNLFFELSPDLLCIAGFDGYFKKINKSFCKTLGYTQEELLNENLFKFTHPDDKAKTEDILKLLDDGEPIPYFENRYVTKSGHYVWLAWTSTPIIEEKLIFAIGKDITEKKQQEEAIKISNKKVSDTLESIQDGFYAIDNDSIITYWNNEAEKLLGKKREDVLGKNLWEIFPEAVNLKFYPNYSKAKAKNIPVRFEEYFPPLKSWYEITAFPSEEGVSVHFKNVTDRKNSEIKMIELNDSLAKKANELAESNAELEQFAFIASHDMQEPLRMVTSFLNKLENKYANALDAKGLQYLHYATDGAIRMRQIILDLLEFSRIGKINHSIEIVDLNELMNDIKHMNQDVIEKTKAAITWDKLPAVKFGKGPLYQIFQNIISNAIKYQKAGNLPKVHVTYEDCSNYWIISIKDNGIGIEKEYHEKIFEIFKRLHQKEEYSGTGIGLAICKKIIERSGGIIYVESEINFGSNFKFTIKKEL
ncbi:PAS domain S-box protein [Belliella sp. R4-6]|uniref:histidine kinase n=1 Tax=Belliella alkalica TaxID=1730871 RepID=A0ABS9V800_9BACT|nr:PAS domain S-box protein [Belliella alkalica]MCH7412260.1 PAS domain S-box protein [Belliella alkalica]